MTACVRKLWEQLPKNKAEECEKLQRIYIMCYSIAKCNLVDPLGFIQVKKKVPIFAIFFHLLLILLLTRVTTKLYTVYVKIISTKTLLYYPFLVWSCT